VLAVGSVGETGKRIQGRPAKQVTFGGHQIRRNFGAGVAGMGV